MDHKSSNVKLQFLFRTNQNGKHFVSISRVFFSFYMYCRSLLAGRSSERGWSRQRGGSSVAGRVSVVFGSHAPLVSAPSWTAAAAAKPVHGRLGNHATRGTSVTLTRACTVTFPKTSRVMRLASALVSERFMENPVWLLQHYSIFKI